MGTENKLFELHIDECEKNELVDKKPLTIIDILKTKDFDFINKFDLSDLKEQALEYGIDFDKFVYSIKTIIGDKLIFQFDNYKDKDFKSFYNNSYYVQKEFYKDRKKSSIYKCLEHEKNKCLDTKVVYTCPTYTFDSGIVSLKQITDAIFYDCGMYVWKKVINDSEFEKFLTFMEEFVNETEFANLKSEYIFNVTKLLLVRFKNANLFIKAFYSNEQYSLVEKLLK